MLSEPSTSVVCSEHTRKMKLGNENEERTTSNERMQYCSESEFMDFCRAGSELYPALF